MNHEGADMQNDQRTEIYLRDRTRLTPAQRRRVAKHDHQQVAQFSRATRRAARREVLAADRRKRFAIRSFFSRSAA